MKLKFVLMNNWHLSLQINSEWWAIQNAKGFENGFINWLADPERLGFRFLRLPTKEGLKIIENIVKKECDRLTSDFQNFRRKAFKIKINVDVLLFGGSFTYKLLRPASKRALQTLTTQHSFTCENSLEPRGRELCCTKLHQLI